jgi:ABC-type transporter Mla maintaining outer membrane lipid asymmetry ATPase subunit MlaF
VTVPLTFENIPLSAREREPFTLSVGLHQTVAVLGDEDSGVDRLGGYAMGLERPRVGTARAFDTDVEALPERERLAFRRRVGYLPAGDGLLQNLSLRDNIALPLRFGSDATPFDIDGRVKVILVAVRLGAAADRRPAHANEEECRRAALARAIAFDPLLLVLEQPFDGITALDSHHRSGDPDRRPAALRPGVPTDPRRHPGAGNGLRRGSAWKHPGRTSLWDS